MLSIENVVFVNLELARMAMWSIFVQSLDIGKASRPS